MSLMCALYDNEQILHMQMVGAHAAAGVAGAAAGSLRRARGVVAE